jgi:hypothetical protein
MVSAGHRRQRAYSRPRGRCVIGRALASVFCAMAIGVAGCGGDSAGPAINPVAESLVDPYDCGYGFYLGAPDQTAGLFVVFTDFETALAGNTPQVSTLPDERWVAEIQMGRNLFASWCDDATPEAGQEPVVDEVWTMVAGTITILEMPEPGVCGEARALLEDLAAVTGDETRVELGDFEIRNGSFGCVSG